LRYFVVAVVSRQSRSRLVISTEAKPSGDIFRRVVAHKTRK
jgi:hypothetical protein